MGTEAAAAVPLMPALFTLLWIADDTIRLRVAPDGQVLPAFLDAPGSEAAVAQRPRCVRAMQALLISGCKARSLLNAGQIVLWDTMRRYEEMWRGYTHGQLSI